ncbi:DNA methyltransferase [Rheinheimera fenheensis]|uniref:DNA methyltransferase n=1 Tax=Rheinheimera fenheensis TaxID=3152295 RepID=UPI00325FEE5D
MTKSYDFSSLSEELRIELKKSIDNSLEADGVAILPPMDVMDSYRLMKLLGYKFKVSMLDPWYNKGVGGVRDDYEDFINRILREAAETSEHVYLWGFPEIIALFIKSIPEPLKYNTWLTWYYKNNPSVIRGWRSAQQACLHLSIPNSKIYLEPFLNEKQLQKKAEGKLRYIPGPTSVIEVPLNIGFIGRKEQTGHPAQKPVKVYEPLIKLTASTDELVFDPMAGSGTTGEVTRDIGAKAILCDCSNDFTYLIEKRLKASRINFEL